MNQLEEILRGVEAEAHLTGWNGDLAGPMVFEVHDHDGHMDTSFPPELNMAIISLSQQGHDIGNILVFLAERAETMRANVGQWGFELDLGRNLLGLGLRSEAYSLHYEGTEPLERDLMDIPETRETRIVQFYGKDDRKLHLTRWRDTNLVEVEDVSDKLVGGEIAHGLTRILNALCVQDVPVAPLEPS